MTSNVNAAPSELLTWPTARELFDAVAEIHRASDSGRIADVFTKDVVIEDDGHLGALRGLTEVESFFRTVWRAFPDFRVSIIEGPFVSEGAFAVRGRITATMKGPLDPPGFAPTNQPVSTEFGGFYRVEGDRISYARVIIDTTDFAIQLAALPSRGSPAERIAVAFQRLRARRLRRRR